MISEILDRFGRKHRIANDQEESEYHRYALDATSVPIVRLQRRKINILAATAGDDLYQSARAEDLITGHGTAQVESRM